MHQHYLIKLDSILIYSCLYSQIQWQHPISRKSMNLSHFGSFKKRCLNFSVHFRSLSAYFLTAYSPSSYVFYPVTASLTGNWGQCLFFTAAVKCVGSRDRKTGVGVRLECCETSTNMSFTPLPSSTQPGQTKQSGPELWRGSSEPSW